MEPLPPVDFPLHGLTDGWGAPRWLDSFAAREGTPTGEVWLGQGDSFRPVPGRRWVSVGTYALPFELDTGESLETRPAHRATFHLIDLTMPETRHPDRTIVDLSVEEAQRAADAVDDWPTVSWTVDGREVAARVWSWADCWTGLTVVSPEVAVVVQAHAVAPEGLDLSVVSPTDTSYGFDLSGPLVFPSTVGDARLAVFDESEIDQTPWPRHADHERLSAR